MNETVNSEGVPLREYMRTLRRWWWIVVAGLVVGGALGFVYGYMQTPMYTATAQVVYQTQPSIGNPLNPSFTDTTARQSAIESAPDVVGSSQVAEIAEAKLPESVAAAPHSVSVTLTPGISNDYTNVVGVSGTAGAPTAAAVVADTYARAFIIWNRQTTRAQITRAIQVVQAQMATYTTAAQRATNEYLTLESRLQDLRVLQETTSSDFRFLNAASPPSAPSSPNRTRLIVIGAGAGLIFGILIAFIVAQFDTRLRDEDELVELTRVPVLGHVAPLPHGDASLSGRALPALSEPTGQRAESFRILRSNLDFMNLQNEVRSLAVSSSLQREGKSVVACNLAVSMALAGKRIVLVDADLRSPRVHAYMGLGNATGLSSVIARRLSLQEALQGVRVMADTREKVAAGKAMAAGARAAAGRSSGSAEEAPDGLPVQWADITQEPALLYVLTSGPVPPNPGELVSAPRFGSIIDQLAAHADLVIVDTPAMLQVGDAAGIARSVDALLYVVDPEISRRTTIEAAVRQLEHLPARTLGLVVMRSKDGKGYYGPRDYTYHTVQANNGKPHAA